MHQDCDDCKDNIQQNDIFYCIKCGKKVCKKCKTEWYCNNCYYIEDEYTQEKIIMSRIKPLLIQFKERLDFCKYKEIVQMVKYLCKGRIPLAEKIRDSFKHYLVPKAWEALVEIENIILYDKELISEGIEVPAQPYWFRSGYFQVRN